MNEHTPEVQAALARHLAMVTEIAAPRESIPAGVGIKVGDEIELSGFGLKGVGTVTHIKVENPLRDAVSLVFIKVPYGYIHEKVQNSKIDQEALLDGLEVKR